MCGTVACVVEGPTKPSPVPKEPTTAASGSTIHSEDDEAIQGGKACVLTPADPTLLPVGTYICPNGVVFTQACPATGCPRVAPQPKPKYVGGEAEAGTRRADDHRGGVIRGT